MENNSLTVPVAIVIGAVIIAGALLYTSGMPQTQPTKGDVVQGEVKNNGSTVEFEITPQDHVRGNPNAPITIVEFSDLECPFCKNFHPTMLQVMQEFDGQVQWVYRHFPLSIHAQAIPAALASECVTEQAGNDGFWEFTDRVFANQNRIGTALYEEVAQDIGVNMQEYQTCIAEKRYEDIVIAQYNTGVQAGVNGTPGSFVNGVPVRGAIPYAQLKSIIEQELSSL